MKHPNFTVATILFCLAMLTGTAAFAKHQPLFAIASVACFIAGIYAAFGGKVNNNNNN